MLSMMMNVLSVFLALVATALAAPLAFTSRDSVSPPITNPTAQTVWTVGDTVTVEWDVAALNGAQPSNPLAEIILGTLADNVEHLMIESPLASNFPILNGSVSLVVPSVPSGSDYIVCLFGTTGDISPTFTIIGTDAPSSTLDQTLAASRSNTLPPHRTTDRATTVSLPPTGVTRTDPGTSATSSPPSSVSSTNSASGSVTTGAQTSGSTTAAGSSANATSSSASSTSTSPASGGADNSGSMVSVTGVHFFSAVSAAFVLLTFL